MPPLAAHASSRCGWSAQQQQQSLHTCFMPALPPPPAASHRCPQRQHHSLRRATARSAAATVAVPPGPRLATGDSPAPRTGSVNALALLLLTCVGFYALAGMVAAGAGAIMRLAGPASASSSSSSSRAGWTASSWQDDDIMPLLLVYKEDEEESAEDAADAPHIAAWGVLAQQPLLPGQLQASPALRVVRVVKRGCAPGVTGAE